MGNKYIVYETKYGNIKFPIENESIIHISKFDDIVIRILSFLEVHELQGGTVIKSGELIVDKHFLEENDYKFDFKILKEESYEQELEKTD